MSNNAVSSGIGFGSCFAIVLSWVKWHSFWWVLLHGILGWIYVAYFFITGLNN